MNERKIIGMKEGRKKRGISDRTKETKEKKGK
jgi:hypothetical protein